MREQSGQLRLSGAEEPLIVRIDTLHPLLRSATTSLQWHWTDGDRSDDRTREFPQEESDGNVYPE